MMGNIVDERSMSLADWEAAQTAESGDQRLCLESGPALNPSPSHASFRSFLPHLFALLNSLPMSFQPHTNCVWLLQGINKLMNE